MALVGDVLRANEALSGLSDDQVAAIETLSKNDETTVIGETVGKLHGDYDKDVLEVTGIGKAQGEKSYNYVKRVLGSFKESAGKAAELEGTISNLNTKIADYETKIANGTGDEVIKAQLVNAQAKLEQIQGQYDTDKQGWEKERSNFATEMNSVKVNNAFGSVKLKFKSDYPESIQSTLINSTKKAILDEFTPDWIDNGKGGKVMVFKDKNGIIQNNLENKLEPYTAEELMRSKLKDVLDFGRQQSGGGSNPNGGSGGQVDVIDISTAKTQVEADEMITKALLQKGLTRESQAFADAQTEMRRKADVAKLPIR